MTIDEVFTGIGRKMVEGLMFHSQLHDYFLFLGLKGYAESHKYHYFEESCNYKRMGCYYLKHFNKIIAEAGFTAPKVIPEGWGKYTRDDVNISTRKSGIATGFDRWITWEKEVKKYYEQMYKELINMDEVAAAAELLHYIQDVDGELAAAHQKMLELKAIDYNISDIIDEQEEYYKCYKKKLKELEL